MLRRYLTIGFFCCWALVMGQVLIEVQKDLRYNYSFFLYFLRISNAVLTIAVLFVLWRILVKYYEQHELSGIMRGLMASAFLLILFGFFSPLRLEAFIFWTGYGIVALIYLIFSFVFFYRVMYIDDMAIPTIEALKNYCLSFVVCFFCFLALFICSLFCNFGYINILKPVMIIVPWVFLSIFFLRTKRSFLHE